MFTQTRNLAQVVVFFKFCSTKSAGSPESCCRSDRISPDWGLDLMPGSDSDHETQESLSLSLTFIHGRPSQIPAGAEERTRECREQEYKDGLGNCKACKQCDAGQELSKVSPLCLIWPCFNRVHAGKAGGICCAGGAFIASPPYFGRRKCCNTKDTQQDQLP